MLEERQQMQVYKMIAKSFKVRGKILIKFKNQYLNYSI